MSSHFAHRQNPGSPRPSRAETRNPLLRLPAAKRIGNLPEPTREELAVLLSELARDARDHAEASWRANKAPMAAYWKAVSVYAGHLRRVLRQPDVAGRHPSGD